ncbi:MAG: hypothetical protein P8X74_23840 [Reinekea sp.]
MDKQKVKQLAEELEFIAGKCASDSNVNDFLNSLKEVLSNAKSESIKVVIDHVPGEYFFQEGDLSKHADLEIAYSKFKLALLTEDKQYDDLKAWAEKRKQQLFDKK